MTALRAACAIAIVFTAATAEAGESFVTLTDSNGTIATRRIDSRENYDATSNEILEAFLATGEPIPEILSVWTAFGLGGSRGGTYFVGLANDVTGIGLQSVYEGDGTFESPAPPLRSMLLHNSFLFVAEGAQRHRAPTDGYGQYLFLLELSHQWGPAFLTSEAFRSGELIGFPFHWSFFMDAGGPAGGNVWIDNNDGTFTTATPAPGALEFSMLDLYLMGLADASEVPDVNLLRRVTVPPDQTDPLWGGAIQPRTFPWFDAEPLTVTATRKTFTMEELVNANGARVPAFGEAPTSYTFRVALILAKGTTPERARELEQQFDPFARTLAPAFERATRGRGRLVPLEPEPIADGGVADAGPSDAGAVTPLDAGTVQTMTPAPEPDGCTCVRTPRRDFTLIMLWGIGVWLMKRRTAPFGSRS